MSEKHKTEYYMGLQIHYAGDGKPGGIDQHYNHLRCR